VAQVVCPVLIGRDAEFSLIRAAVESAQRSDGGAVVVVGEAGVGKSRLIREAVTVAREAGCAVLTGRAVQVGMPVVYRPLAEALTVAARHSDLLDSPQLRPFLGALGRLMPDLRPSTSDSADAVAIGEGALRLLRLVARAERGGAAVLVLEDLHSGRRGHARRRGIRPRQRRR
jgi:hypothetical protein